MNKNTVKLVTPIIATSLAFASVAPAIVVNADEINNNTEVSAPSVGMLTDADTLAANNYISFDINTKQFVVDSAIANIFPAEKVALVEEYVKQTNIQLAGIKQDGSEVASVVDTDGDETVLTPVLLRGAGVNSITFHWNYARIKIKASSVSDAVALGFIIGGIKIEADIIKIACGAAGLKVSKYITRGIWFDYNYLVGVFTGNAGLQ
ncbi:hypothetical protein HCJ66_12140 [Listeria sp. FSL L7-1582]|uniref:hypothetical protein n=1 Tax=Listeria portnoyi TaxID=2713504 RepID=UPI00164E5C56|nr:hypothetical protein [Listeria portnoyi]MBC6310289.1 hypothetical protein [Listeria portnoyi]